MPKLSSATKYGFFFHSFSKAGGTFQAIQKNARQSSVWAELGNDAVHFSLPPLLRLRRALSLHRKIFCLYNRHRQGSFLWKTADSGSERSSSMPQPCPSRLRWSQGGRAADPAYPQVYEV